MVVSSGTASSIAFEEDDLPYEEDILRNAFSVKCWQRYIEHKKKKQSLPERVNVIYERALKELPGSYKLWYDYLKTRRQQTRNLCINDPKFEATNACFERAFVFMHKMPRIWLDYCKYLTDQQLVSRCRRAFDRALRSLAITQHHRIWPSYLQFVRQHTIPETAIRVYRRYLKLSPENREEFVDYLRDIGRLDDAAIELAKIVNDEKFVSKENKSNHQLWHDLCSLMAKNPLSVKSLSVEPIIRQGIKRYSDQVGQLWAALADYYIRSTNFERARDVYEEAVQSVTTVRDFTQVFDAYAQFEERLATNIMDQAAKAGSVSSTQELDIELLLARFENLMDRRPILLNSVLLRQNPHNVHEWHKRAQLFESRPDKVIETYTEAVQTVNPKHQTGKLSSLWVAFAKFYEKNQQFTDTELIYERALKESFNKVDELATVWCEYAEFELRLEKIEIAIKLMKRATAPPPHKTHYFDETEQVSNRVYKSLKVWSFYADLEESFGTFESCKNVYERIIDLRIATPQIIINFSMFLEEHKHFEEAFKTYEKGIGLFKWPVVYDIWNTYLVKFIKRYGGKKLERARDLFEQCLDSCPPEHAKNFYLMYAKLEEEHGLSRHAMDVFNRATKAVAKDEIYDVVNVYIKKATEWYGVTKSRPIYEDAIERLPEDKSRELCMRYADLERKLGEIDRARAIYAHCAQICDPRLQPLFWDMWKDFEVRHGNEDTVREMLRIKRSVQATYNTQVNYMSAQMLAAATGLQKTTEELTAGDSMAMLEAKVAKLVEEEAKAPSKTGSNISFVKGESQAATANKEIIGSANPDAIDLGDDLDAEMDSDEEEQQVQHILKQKDKTKDINVEKQMVPTEVFGGLVQEDED